MEEFTILLFMFLIDRWHADQTMELGETVDVSAGLWRPHSLCDADCYKP